MHTQVPPARPPPVDTRPDRLPVDTRPNRHLVDTRPDRLPNRMRQKLEKEYRDQHRDIVRDGESTKLCMRSSCGGLYASACDPATATLRKGETQCLHHLPSAPATLDPATVRSLPWPRLSLLTAPKPTRASGSPSRSFTGHLQAGVATGRLLPLAVRFRPSRSSFTGGRI